MYVYVSCTPPANKVRWVAKEVVTYLTVCFSTHFPLLLNNELPPRLSYLRGGY